MCTVRYRRPIAARFASSKLAAALACFALLQSASVLSAQPNGEATKREPAMRPLPQLAPQPVMHRVRSPSERLEMIVTTSRVLALDKRIPQAQVNNPDILGLTVLSPTEVQIYARRPGVTQVNLWDENNNIHTLDVMVYGDARELARHLKMQFPTAAIDVVPTGDSVILKGTVDDPNHVSLIMQIAQVYYPNVIPNITVTGVQQVLLKTKVVEVSRTKLRSVGIDFANITSGGDFVGSSITGILQAAALTGGQVGSSGNQTLQFGILDPGNSFFAFIEALRQDNLAKILAEPKLVTMSGRPASFNSGGEFPIPVPQALGTVSIEYRRFGTEMNFVPIVLGGGLIRLEIRPRISEIDASRSFQQGDISVPGLRVREADTSVELRAGQTIAIAGLVQTRTETQVRGIPWASDLPYVGTLFRRTRNQDEEVELLIMVTPELVEALDPCETPKCGPGQGTDTPNDIQLHFRGLREVPSCGPCGPGLWAEAADGIPGEGHGGPGYPGAVHGGERIEMLPEGTRVEPLPPSQPAPMPPSEKSAAEPTARVVVPATRYNRSTPHSRTSMPGSNGSRPSATGQTSPGFIGPIGYDVVE